MIKDCSVIMETVADPERERRVQLTESANSPLVKPPILKSLVLERRSFAHSDAEYFGLNLCREIAGMKKFSVRSV